LQKNSDMGYNHKMNEDPGKLIVFEGIDGSGKTTISKRLYSHLKNKGIDVVWFRAPSDSKWGKTIRDLANRKDAIPIEKEFLYFLRDRKWDVKHNINPALERGKTVILDRYFFSSACYQGARGMDMNRIISVNTEFSPPPDLLFIIDVDIHTAMSRIRKSREAEAKLFEKESFIQKVRKNYSSLDYDFIRIIDGTRSIGEVTEDVISSYERTFLR